LYNQQQLEFIARKNALSAQQFDFADKLSSYNAQVKTFTENLQKTETERIALQAEKAEFEKQLKEFETSKAELETEKKKLEEEKETLHRERVEAQKKALEDNSGIQARMLELQERENRLLQRENALNEHLREFNSRPAAPYADERYGYNSPYGYQNQNPYHSLHERAQSDGIRLNTAGNMRSPAIPQREIAVANANEPSRYAKTYNVGVTLFKAAIIMLCIVAFESIVVFFTKDYLGVPAYYPAIGFGIGFFAFLVCAILHARGFRPNVRRKKHPSYLLTTAILFVICVIAVTMIAVYLKADISNPAQLFAYVIVPVVYLSNILIFTAFYHMFSIKG
jgi:hypothetical protein